MAGMNAADDAILLSREEILQRIPHGPEALLLSSARLSPGRRITAEARVAGDEWFFRGHYPGKPILPGYILVEMFGQAGAILTSSLAEGIEGVMVLAGTDRLRFLRPTAPPATLTLVVEPSDRRLGVVRLDARAEGGAGELIARGTLLVSRWNDHA